MEHLYTKRILCVNAGVMVELRIEVGYKTPEST